MRRTAFASSARSSSASPTDGGATWSRSESRSAARADGVLSARVQPRPGLPSGCRAGRDDLRLLCEQRRDRRRASRSCSSSARPTRTARSPERRGSEPVIVSNLVGGDAGRPERRRLPVRRSSASRRTATAVSEAMSVSNSVDAAGSPLRGLGRFPEQPERRGCTGPADVCERVRVTTTSSTRVLDGRGRDLERAPNITPRGSLAFGETAQWQPWSEVAADGSRLCGWPSTTARTAIASRRGATTSRRPRSSSPASPAPTYRLLARDDGVDAEPHG